MFHRLPILLLLVSLFVALSASSAQACGQSSECGKTVEKSCCAKKNPAQKSACGENHPGRPCAGAHGCSSSSCPCPVTSGVSSSATIEEFPPSFPPLSTSDEAILRQAFYYAQHLPEAVYLAIWQPPQLAV